MNRQTAIGLLALLAMFAVPAFAQAQDKEAGKPTPAPAATTQPAEPAPKPPVPVTVTKPAPPAEPPAKPAPTPRPIEGLKAVKTPSGLTYYDIKIGEGETPRSGATVRVECLTWDTTGKLLDSTRERGHPFMIRTNERFQIPAWIESIQTMKPGGIRRLEAPAKLAKGHRRQQFPKIPPNTDVVFEMELLKIQEQGPAQTSVAGLKEVTTDSGLKYWDITPGTGDSPGDLDRVKIEFLYWLDDGTLIGSSARRGRPLLGPLSRFVTGWAEGLRTMKVGGKRRVYISPELGYGDSERRGGLPANSTLIVEMELLEVLHPLPQASVEGIEPVVTPSGLKYWEIKEGMGEKPTPASTVRVHYSGWLMNGFMFDSSVQRGESIAFRLNRVIPGWTEGVGTMKVGGKRRLEIPPDLGYGKQGQQDIPPDSTLIFEVELLGIE